MIGTSRKGDDVGVAVVAMDHTLEWVNGAFAEIIGYVPGELFGRTFDSITHRDDLDLDRQLCDRLFKNEISNYEMEKRYIHKNGSVVAIHLGVRLVRDRSGNILYALSTVERMEKLAKLEVRASQPLTPKEAELDRIRRAVLG